LVRRLIDMAYDEDDGGSVADDMTKGDCCSHCGTYFTNSDGFPVLCEDCFAEDKGETGLPKSQYPEFGEEQQK
jgi:hypothetical protein